LGREGALSSLVKNSGAHFREMAWHYLLFLRWCLVV
jgi:hypothetical protein